MKKVLILIFLTINLSAEDIKIYGLLKKIYNANALQFYNKDYGYIVCGMYGIQTVDNITLTEESECQIDALVLKKMEFYTTLEASRIMHLEQKYRLILTPKGCMVQNGAHLYSKQILKRGYGFLYKKLIDEKYPLINAELERVYEKAKREKLGLFHEWSLEMACINEELNKDE